MLILTQAPWATDDIDGTLKPMLTAAKAEAASAVFREFDATLLLLPHAEGPMSGAISANDLTAKVAGLAKEAGLYVAGSGVVTDQQGANRTIGFLVSDAGEVLLSVNKISPDFLNGFTDTTCDMGKPADFPVAETPLGKVGILPGEDILFAHYARSLAWNGAELLLNPCLERRDPQLEMRLNSRFGRSTDNNCIVACASPRSKTVDGVQVALPPATAIFCNDEGPLGIKGSETFYFPDYDLEAIRRMRVNPGPSLPAINRAGVFSATYSDEPPVPADAIPQTRNGWLEEAKRRLEKREAEQGPIMEGAHEQYGCVLVQQIPRLIKLDGKFDPKEIMQKNLDTALALAGTRAAVPTMRLVVFPEFWLTGPGGIGGVQRTPDQFGSMAITYPGPIFDQISEFAQKFGVYVAFQNFEVDPNFPNHVFNAAFLINDSGDLVHRYRKIQDADVWGLFPSTTPGSVLDRYLDVYGPEGIFPVARTPIGNLANMVCFDTMTPEVARGLTKAGAEVILHSSSEPHGANMRKRWDNSRILRGFENTALVLSAIDGGEYEVFDSDEMTFFRRGHTRAVNFDGTLLGTCDGPGPVAWRVELDLAALRRARRNPSAQIALWDDQSVYAAHYQKDVGMPSNLWNGDPMVNPYEKAIKVRERIEDYVKRGIYTPPSREVLKAADNISDTM